MSICVFANGSRFVLPDQFTAGFQELSARSMLLERDAYDLRGSFLHGLMPSMRIQIRRRKPRIDRVHRNALILQFEGQLDREHVQRRLRRTVSQHLHLRILPRRVAMPRATSKPMPLLAPVTRAMRSVVPAMELLRDHAGPPPLTSKCWPLTKADRSLAKYSAASATSPTVPALPIGLNVRMNS